MPRLLGFAAALFVAGCAEPAFVVAPQTVEFELSGRFAVSYRGEANSGNLAWRHGADAEELLITSPLGQGVARISRTGREVVLTTPEPREYRAADAEALTEKVLGFRLPLAGMADWVRARPAPGASQSRRDAEGRLAELAQGGWTIRYLEYDEGKRPSRLRMTYPGVDLRLAITEWK
ncbi:MAG: lipoprotein insertase outer membrane protein LolB [Betaproteobacteria bacterium]